MKPYLQTLLLPLVLGGLATSVWCGHPPSRRAQKEVSPVERELSNLQRRVRQLEAVIQVAAPAPEETTVAEQEIQDRIRRVRPQTAGPLRQRISLDLDQNRSITDLGPSGSGRDGVLILGVASLEETSPWEWLRSYDTNLDSRLDSLDYGFANLQVWIDQDRDLVPRRKEMFTPDQIGIQRIHIPLEPGQERSQWEADDGAVHLAGLTDY